MNKNALNHCLEYFEVLKGEMENYIKKLDENPTDNNEIVNERKRLIERVEDFKIDCGKIFSKKDLKDEDKNDIFISIYGSCNICAYNLGRPDFGRKSEIQTARNFKDIKKLLDEIKID